MTTVRYGNARTRSPPPTVPAGATAVPAARAVISRPSRADSQHKAASSANTPMNTAPCALASPAPLSQ